MTTKNGPRFKPVKSLFTSSLKPDWFVFVYEASIVFINSLLFHILCQNGLVLMKSLKKPKSKSGKNRHFWEAATPEINALMGLSPICHKTTDEIIWIYRKLK